MADTLIPDTLDLTDHYDKAPEYEAGVALVLWRAVIRAEGGRRRNLPPRTYLLDTFAECLTAAEGKRACFSDAVDEFLQRLVKH